VPYIVCQHLEIWGGPANKKPGKRTENYHKPSRGLIDALQSGPEPLGENFNITERAIVGKKGAPQSVSKKTQIATEKAASSNQF